MKNNLKYKINKLNKNKKGVELALTTIVVFIILVITLFVIINFFSGNYIDNSNKLIEIGNNSINQYRN